MSLKLVCFDLDGTILNGRLHHALAKAGIEPGKADAETVRNQVWAIGGIKNPQALKATIKKLLDSGVNIAITSYTGYCEAIPVVLQMIGLSSEDIHKIKNASFNPPKGPNGEKIGGYGKNNHIERAIEAFGGGIKPEEVVLVDDRVDHYELAKQKGYNVIWVQGSEGKIDYLNELREMASLSKAESMQTNFAPAVAPEPQGFVDRILSWVGLARIAPAISR